MKISNYYEKKLENVGDLENEFISKTQKKVPIHQLINFDGTENVKVSIIVPVCNVERYLRECLDSAISQTMQDIEIICVNHGSTDSSEDILEEYAQIDNRIKVIDKENAGYGHAMNIGMDMAKGEYIGIIESDDYVLPDMFNTLYNIAVENELDFVKSDFYRFYGEGQNLQKEYNKVARVDENYNVILNPSENHEVFKFLMNTWSGLYKTKFLRENNIRHNETPGASFQDNGFWFKCNVFGKKTMVINQAFYMNRRDNPDSSVYNPQKVYCGNVEYDYIYNFLKENDLFDKFSEVYLFKKFHTYKFTINRIAEKFRKEYIHNISNEFNNMEKKGELASKYLSNTDWNIIHWIMRDPDEYYYVGLKNEITVSVILPVYNVEDYLDECLISIENQTLKKIEIICVDDGSTDGSLEIIRNHQNRDHRIRIISQQNGGAGRARNEGMKIARGRYLSFLDADDYIDINTFELAVDRAEKNDADITIYRSYLYDNETGLETKNTYSVRTDKLPAKESFSRNEIQGNIFTDIMGWAWDKLYKASFVYNSGLQFQEQRTTNDMYFVYASLLRAPRITILNKFLYHQRRNVRTSLSNTREKSWECFYNALIKLKEELKSNEIYDVYEQDYVNYALHSCLWNFNTLKEPICEQLFIKLRTQWFDDLGINGRSPEFYINKNEYNQYLQIVSISLEQPNSYLDYKINMLLEKNEYADNKQKVMVSAKETLTVEQLVEKLQWNRDMVSKYRVELKNAERQYSGGYEVNEIINSFSYKLGHALTIIPRWIRHIVKRCPM